VRFIDRAGFDGLLAELRARGYRLIGPAVRDGVIVLDEIDGAIDLPVGVHEEQEAGRYRTEPAGAGRIFGFAHGPDSAKRFLFPAREVTQATTRTGRSLTVVPPEDDGPPLAFVGLRSCDLHAVLVQDRVLMPDPGYRRRRTAAFFVGVNCAEPGATCFCVSTGTGPRCTVGFDLALTELDGGFLMETGTPLGGDVLAAIPSRPAAEAEVAEAAAVSKGAEASMGRRLETDGLRELLYRNRTASRWASLAERCLACGNCTAVCPTCFCTDVVDTADLTGKAATRTREWASCFSAEFGHTAGGDVRTGRDARYRQWLTHKFGSWIDQFGTSGCVGCGRCITWCPVGIDVTKELAAIRAGEGLAEVGS